MCECLIQIIAVLKILVPVVLWLVFWLCAVNWKKTWPVLRIGGWAPMVLLVLVCAGVWSRIVPGPCNCLNFVSIPSFLWQLGAVSCLAALALFCGWLQGYLGWTPTEYAVEPPLGRTTGTRIIESAFRPLAV